MKIIKRLFGNGIQILRRRLARFLAATIAVLAFAEAAHPATNTVSSLLDSGPGSLRATIASAAAGDSIVFGVTGAISLTGGELTLGKDLAIAGPGASALAISGNQSSRLFSVGSNVTAQISGLTLQDGQAAPSEHGGAIYNAGHLRVSSCVIASNSAGNSFSLVDHAGGKGGGIFSVGILLVENSIISWNRTGAGAAGGNQHLNGNPGWGGGSGGGICSEGSMLSILGSSLSNNIAGGGGAGGFGQVGGGFGGGGGAGGGIFLLTGIVERCSIVSNYAGPGGRGGSSSASPSGGGNGGAGGGICGAVMMITNCTIAGNYAGGGGEGGLRTSFPMGTAGGGPGGDGGGIQCAGYTNAIFVACTIAGNHAGRGGYGGTEPFPNFGPDGYGGGCANLGGGRQVLLNSIVADNLVGPSPDVYGLFLSLGHNLVGITNGSSGFNAPGDLTGTLASALDPKLAGLAGNGGLTVTMALMSDSPAINAGTTQGSPALDQRGVMRPQGLGVDIGAYEYQFASPLITGEGFLSPSQFWLQGCGLPNHFYALQTSTNLSEWTDLIGLITNPNGLCEAVDLNTTNYSARFYRLKAFEQ